MVPDTISPFSFFRAFLDFFTDEYVGDDGSHDLANQIEKPNDHARKKELKDNSFGTSEFWHSIIILSPLVTKFSKKVEKNERKTERN